MSAPVALAKLPCPIIPYFNPFYPFTNEEIDMLEEEIKKSLEKELTNQFTCELVRAYYEEAFLDEEPSKPCL